MQLSVIIPAHNESKNIESTIIKLEDCLKSKINGFYDYLIIADHCTDNTEDVLTKLEKEYKDLKWIRNEGQPGFGMAVRAGLNNFIGDAVVIYMADYSDSPKDILLYYDKLCEGYECVFGSRFIKDSNVKNYPKHKFFLNRFTNFFIKVLFCYKYNDTTNAFKAYRKEVIEGCKPFLSPHFNLTVELPLKSIIRGYKYTIVPISWTGRRIGKSNLKIKEMGSRYFFIIFYCFIEKWMSRNDYYRKKEDQI